MKHPIIVASSACGCRALKQADRRNQWVGCSQFLPGGGAGPDSTPFEKVYVVLEGEMTVIINGVETLLHADGFLHHCAE